MTDEKPRPVDAGQSDLQGAVSRAHGRAVIAGRIEVVEEGGDNFKHDLALVIVFETPDACRKALVDGCCTFTFGNG